MEHVRSQFSGFDRETFSKAADDGCRYAHEEKLLLG
jgi:hypothetical protein